MESTAYATTALVASIARCIVQIASVKRAGEALAT